MEGRIWKISSSSSFSSSSVGADIVEDTTEPVTDSDDISDAEVESFLEGLGLSPSGSNDIDVATAITNDTDIPEITNDLDEPSSDLNCSIQIKNNNNFFEVWDGTNILHKFNQTSEKFILALCGYSHSITFTAYGSFIFDVGVDIGNTQDTSIKGGFLDLVSGGTLILTSSKKNIRFTGGVGEEATIVFDPAVLVSTTPAAQETTDCPPAHGCLTSNEAIRRFVLDRMIDDNSIDLELFFTDEEIDHARHLAVANWNEIPPYVGTIVLTKCDDCLPYPTIFVNGISYYLYLSKIQKLQKEDLDYNAGGMQVDLNKRRIAHLTANIKAFKEEFVTLASSRKTYINYQGAWGQIG